MSLEVLIFFFFLRALVATSDRLSSFPSLVFKSERVFAFSGLF